MCGGQRRGTLCVQFALGIAARCNPTTASRATVIPRGEERGGGVAQVVLVWGHDVAVGVGVVPGPGHPLLQRERPGGTGRHRRRTGRWGDPRTKC